MDIFPTRYSLLSAQALNLKIQADYLLQNTTCRLLIHNVSDTYVVENATSKYIFKIYRDAHRKLEEIQGEVELLNLLHQHGASVAYPIADSLGEQIQAFNAAEGTRYGVLFRWAPGKVVYAMSPQQLETAGREMALIHNLTAGLRLQHFRKAFTLQSTIREPLGTLAPFFAELPEEYQYLSDTAAEVLARMEQLDLRLFSQGYCHFDFLPKNFHFDEDDRITFFDFDFAGPGLLAYDITSFYIHYFLEVTFGKISQEEAAEAFRTFVTSYRSVRPLHADELEAIPYLGFAFWLFYFGFYVDHFEDWSNLFFGPKFIRERVGLIRTWMETTTRLNFCF